MFKFWVLPILAPYFASAVAVAHSLQSPVNVTSESRACDTYLKTKWPSLKPITLIPKYDPGVDDLAAIRSREQPNAAPYMTPVQQRLVEVKVGENGLLYYAWTGSLLDSQDFEAEYVLTLDGRLLVFPRALLELNGGVRFLKSLNLPVAPFLKEDGRCCLVVYHSVLAGGARSVLMAGSIVVSMGRVTYISNASGHYKPNAWLFARFLESFEQKGVDLSQSEVSVYFLDDQPISTNLEKIKSAFQYYNDREPEDFWSKVKVIRALYGDVNFDFELELLRYEKTDDETLRYLAREFDPAVQTASYWDKAHRFVPIEALGPLYRQMNLLVTLGQILVSNPDTTLPYKLMEFMPSESNRKWLNHFAPRLASSDQNDLFDSDDFLVFPIQFLRQRLDHLSSVDWIALIQNAENEGLRQRLLAYAYRMNVILPEHTDFFAQALNPYIPAGPIPRNTIFRVLALNVLDHRVPYEVSRARLTALANHPNLNISRTR